jgi:hypothetical protein
MQCIASTLAETLDDGSNTVAVAARLISDVCGQ